MSHEGSNWALRMAELEDITTIEAFVMLILGNCHNPVYGCFPQHEYIAKKTKSSKRTVIRTLQSLKRKGLVKWEETRSGQRQGPNKYCLMGLDEPINSQGVILALSEISQGDSHDGLRVTSETSQSDNGVTHIDNGKETVRGTVTGLERFDEFWDAYAHKKGKEGAQRVWKRKKLDNKADDVIEGARRYVATRGSDSKYWKHAQGWLNDGRWEDTMSTGALSGNDLLRAHAQGAG